MNDGIAEPAAPTGSQSSTQWNGWHALLVVVGSQLLFWALLIAGELAVLPDGNRYVPAVTLTLLDSPESPATTAPIEVLLDPAPVYRQPDPQRHAIGRFSYGFERDVGIDDYALYLAWSRRVETVRLNGVALSTPTPLDLWGVLGGFDPRIYPLPTTLLRAGENRIEFDVNSAAVKVLPVFFVGAADALFGAYAWAELIAVDLVVVSIGVMLFVALLLALTPWPAEYRTRIRALIVLLLLWSIRNLSFLGVDGGLPAAYSQAFHYQLTFAFLFGLLAFVARWTGAKSPRIASLVLGVALLSAAALIASSWGSQAVFRWMFPLESMLSLGVVVYCAWRLVRFAALGTRVALIEAGLFLVCITAVGVDAVDDRFDIHAPFLADLPLTFYVAPLCGLLLALGSCSILIAQSQRARRLSESLNQVLEQRVAEREAQLQTMHQREQTASQARAILEERQRLMRDMHDGLGGQLLSLLMRIRGEPLSTELVANEVSRSLDDLRLIVTSLDRADETLGIAMGSFRERMEPRFRAAGIELIWQMDALAARSRLTPERMLQLLRLLQEACTNTIRHSGASRCVVALAARGAGDGIHVRVEDNGSGIDQRQAAGKGLQNMRTRAIKLGSELVLHSDDGGTRISTEILTDS